MNYYNSKYNRIYFGNEFCERLIPDRRQLQKVLKLVKEKGLQLTFVTPYVTDIGISKLKPLLLYLSRACKHSEVVINSYGMLRLVNKFELKPVIGRLLVKQKKGPEIITIEKMLPIPAMQRFQQTNITSIVEKFFKENHVQRIELDNPFQGIDLSLKLLKASIYYPYVHVTTSRFCMSNQCEDSWKRKIVGIFPCRKECQKYTFELKNKHMPVPLILKGNTQFFRNDNLPEGLEGKSIDRLVYQPEIPI